jgi:hypothetical protein|tara:strand:- start:37 stop:180 length:144 start_codon:yes stop_codon:yes gene_type:complete
MPLQITIGNFIGRNIEQGFPPPGSDEIVTQQLVQMVDEATSDDLITE